MIQNKYFLKKAAALLPELREQIVEPVLFEKKQLATGDSLVLDFGNHYVGYLTMELGFSGSHPDAPVWLKVQFAERLTELSEDVDTYQGWISKAWVQSEQLHVDVLPQEISLPRRYAFRYVKITVLDVSSKFRLIVKAAQCRAVSSADDGRLAEFAGSPEDKKLDAIACRTLHNCMQRVFEDGPKRDRRLWIGDLRLQALANYETYRQNDLVKACLYLFAGSTLPDGHVSACIFLEPEIEADDTQMFDYSLFFIATLRDYLDATGDRQTAEELYPTALRQWELARAQFDERNMVKDSDVLGWCFVDWNLMLNKQASAQAIYRYCARALMDLSQKLGVNCQQIEDDLKAKIQACQFLYDQEKGVYISGADGQVSYASQIWMVLAGVCDGTVLDAAAAIPEAVQMVTPYLYHHYVEALLQAGQKQRAMEVLRSYWGGMASQGADTFWELYNPENPDESPYGGTVVNSYCHAWSCAPAYFLRKTR